MTGTFDQKHYQEMLLYQSLLQYGDFFELNVHFEPAHANNEIINLEHLWRPYNQNKPDYKRFGMSLFSLDGSTSGEIDLNSVLEFNKLNGTNYDELSFRTPTEAWHKIPSISLPLANLEPLLGRSHLIRFNTGGFFPPHRDDGTAFRLISFINTNYESLYLTLDKKVLPLTCGRLYFLNVKKEHSLISFVEGATILVLNVEVSENSVRWVQDNLLVY